MIVLRCKPVHEPWVSGDLKLYLVQEYGKNSFRKVSDGMLWAEHSSRTRTQWQYLLDDSEPVPPELWPRWAIDPDLLVDEGL